jgi:hypothetical protein
VALLLLLLLLLLPQEVIITRHPSSRIHQHNPINSTGLLLRIILFY